MREIEYGVAPRLIAAVGGPTPGSVKGRHFGLLFVELSDRKACLDQASGSMASTPPLFGRDAIHGCGEDRRRFEGENAPRRDRHFHAGTRIAADAFAFGAHQKQAKGAQLHGFAAHQRIGYLVQRHFENLFGLGARKGGTRSINGVQELRSRRGIPVGGRVRRRLGRSTHLVDSPPFAALVDGDLRAFRGRGETGAASLCKNNARGQFAPALAGRSVEAKKGPGLPGPFAQNQG
jgi:hypothetical protein